MQQRAAVGGRAESGASLPADFVTTQNLLFSASKYTIVNGLMPESEKSQESELEIVCFRAF